MAIERKLPDVLEIDFIICDNSLNRKGWRLEVAGIDTAGFLKNPVCVSQHDMQTLSVGKWKSLRVDGDKFLGTLEFDKNDEDAVKLYWKYIDGYMNAVSLHILPVEESNDPSMLVPGQTYATVTKSDLLEISLVTVPGQKNAVKLCTPDGEDYKLSIISNQNQKSKMDPEEKDNSKELQNLQTQLDEQKKLNAKNLVKIHQQRGVVQEPEVEHLNALAVQNYDTVEKMLEARTLTVVPENKDNKDGKPTPAAGGEEGKKLAKQLGQFTQGAGDPKGTKDERASWTYLDYYKKDPEALSAMSANEPEKFKKLEADFETESTKMGLKA
jgi:hypothetical protein